MATKTFKTGTNGLWGTDANWTGGKPVSGDWANLNGNRVILDENTSAYRVYGGGLLTISGSRTISTTMYIVGVECTLDYDATLTIGTSGTLYVSNGTRLQSYMGLISVEGTLNVVGNDEETAVLASQSGSLYVQPYGTLSIGNYALLSLSYSTLRSVVDRRANVFIWGTLIDLFPKHPVTLGGHAARRF